MQEYNDGSFGEIKEGNSLFKELIDNPEEMQKTKAIHFGTAEELLKKKQEVEERKFSNSQTDRLMKKMEQLERKLNRIIFALNAQKPGEILVVD